MFGLIAILVAAITYSRKVMACVPVGYITGFTAGMLFNTDFYNEENGVIYSNSWVIWTVTYLIIVVIGILLELVILYKKRSSNERK
jgi:hypothetical protein